MRGGWGVWVKSIPVEIVFETTDERIIPDLAAVRESAGDTEVAVRNGADWDRRSVELGERNAIEAIVLAGIEPGEEVALENPERP